LNFILQPIENDKNRAAEFQVSHLFYETGNSFTLSSIVHTRILNYNFLKVLWARFVFLTQNPSQEFMFEKVVLPASPA